MNQRIRTVSLLVIVMLIGATSQALAGEDPWNDYRFLIGEWVGEGSGQPGKGSGSFTFAPDLQGNVLVRRNRAEYPAAGNRPASTHEDLMIIYRDRAGKQPQAIYFDNEGHVINYKLAFSEDKQTLTFLSEP